MCHLNILCYFILRFEAKNEVLQARSSLHLSKCHIVGNLMMWLNLKKLAFITYVLSVKSLLGYAF